MYKINPRVEVERETLTPLAASDILRRFHGDIVAAQQPAQKKKDTGGHAPNRSQPVVVPEIAIYKPFRKNQYTTLPTTLMKKKLGTPKHPPVPLNLLLPPHNVETTQPPVACDSSFSS